MAVLAVAIAAAYGFGLHRHLSLQALVEHRAALAGFVDAHAVAAIAAFMALYAAVVALSLPVASALSIAGGLLFGLVTGGLASVIAATIGAMIVFTIVKTSLSGILARKAGPLAARLTASFERDAFSYLLFLRLVPLFPFFAVNAAAGLTRIPFRTFALATFIGIIPGAFVFSYLGTGLDSVIAAQQQATNDCLAAGAVENCSRSLDPAALITPKLLIGLGALGLLALVPALFKRWKAWQA